MIAWHRAGRGVRDATRERDRESRTSTLLLLVPVLAWVALFLSWVELIARALWR